jgi:hypothetical protein
MVKIRAPTSNATSSIAVHATTTVSPRLLSRVIVLAEHLVG